MSYVIALVRRRLHVLYYLVRPFTWRAETHLPVDVRDAEGRICKLSCRCGLVFWTTK
jgi:hypothetical protein